MYSGTIFHDGRSASPRKDLYEFHNKDLLQNFEKLCDWERSENLLKEVTTSTETGLFIFPIFAPSFCSDLVQEMKYFIAMNSISEEKGIEGISLNQFKGVTSFVDWIASHVARLACKVYPPDKILYKLEPFFANVVYYTSGSSSVEHPVHIDDSHLTINISLANNCSGGELYFFNSQTKNLETLQEHPVGSAVMHLGSLPHGVNTVTAGERFNLTIWFKKADKFEQFTSLPAHLQQKIVEYLTGVQDLLHFGSCCKRFLEMSSDDVVWVPLYKSFFNADHGKAKKEFAADYQSLRTKQMKRTLMVWKELVDTEQYYVNSLRTCCNDYLKPMMEWKKKAKDILGDSFALTTKILEQHRELLENERVAISTHDYSRLCGAFFNLFNKIQIYTAYASQHSNLLNSVSKKSFQKKLETLKQQDPSAIGIQGYLIMPLRRIARYNLLIKFLLTFVTCF
eukprot:Phypoly_transcript_05381.p1 GENE.Phypoly_transcript_05381~~Phypoly_transcript_05381.p1  ORF type:complete len:453 (+),score=57.96 Phypoly_transcript_05381:433-1791(+)